MWDPPDWPVAAGAVVCANAVPTPIADERSSAPMSDFIVNSLLNDGGPTAIDRGTICHAGRRYAAIRL